MVSKTQNPKILKNSKYLKNDEKALNEIFKRKATLVQVIPRISKAKNHCTLQNSNKLNKFYALQKTMDLAKTNTPPKDLV